MYLNLTIVPAAAIFHNILISLQTIGLNVLNKENIFFDPNKLKYLGENVRIGKCVRIRNPENVSIGDNSIIDDFTYISSNLELGKYCHIASNVTISGGKGLVKIANFVGIATGSALLSQSSDYINASFELPSIPSENRFGGYGTFITIKDLLSNK